MKRDVAFWESQYNNRAAVPDFQQYFERWGAQSAETRRSVRCYLDVPYGTHAMEKLDIFLPRGASRACLMFIHGGYWRALDKKDHSFVAGKLVEAGVTVAVINYALCPSVTVEGIVRQILQGCAWLYRNGTNFGAPARSLYVSGHSAGGHLTAMAMAAMFPAFAGDLPPNLVQGGLAISGVYDLREIVNVPSINDDVGLDAKAAAKVSPLSYPPATAAPLYLAVGGKELPPFLSQQAALAAKWKKTVAGEIPCSGDHHFSILDQLADPSSEAALFRTTKGRPVRSFGPICSPYLKASLCPKHRLHPNCAICLWPLDNWVSEDTLRPNLRDRYILRNP
jgi:arylformamidase